MTASVVLVYLGVCIVAGSPGDTAGLVQVQRANEKLDLGLGNGPFAAGLEKVLLDNTPNWFEQLKEMGASGQVPQMKPFSKADAMPVTEAEKAALVQVLRTVRHHIVPTNISDWQRPEEPSANLGRWIALGGVILDFIMLMSSAVGLTCVVLSVVVYYGLGVLFWCFYQKVSIPDAILQLSEIVASVGYGSFTAGCDDEESLLDCNMKRLFHSFHGWIGLLLVWPGFEHTVGFTLAAQGKMLMSRWKKQPGYYGDWGGTNWSSAVKALLPAVEIDNSVNVDEKFAGAEAFLETVQAMPPNASQLSKTNLPCLYKLVDVEKECKHNGDVDSIKACLEELNGLSEFVSLITNAVEVPDKRELTLPALQSPPISAKNFFSPSPDGKQCIINEDMWAMRSTLVKVKALKQLVESRIERRATRLVILVNYVLCSVLSWIAFTKDMRDADHYISEHIKREGQAKLGVPDLSPVDVWVYMRSDESDIPLRTKLAGDYNVSYEDMQAFIDEDPCVNGDGPHRYCNYMRFVRTSPTINGLYLLLISFSSIGYGDLTAMSQWCEVASGFILPAGVALISQMTQLGDDQYVLDFGENPGYGTLLKAELKQCR